MSSNNEDDRNEYPSPNYLYKKIDTLIDTLNILQADMKIDSNYLSYNYEAKNFFMNFIEHYPDSLEDAIAIDGVDSKVKFLSRRKDENGDPLYIEYRELFGECPFRNLAYNVELFDSSGSEIDESVIDNYIINFLRHYPSTFSNAKAAVKDGQYKFKSRDDQSEVHMDSILIVRKKINELLQTDLSVYQKAKCRYLLAKIKYTESQFLRMLDEHPLDNVSDAYKSGSDKYISKKTNEVVYIKNSFLVHYHSIQSKFNIYLDKMHEIYDAINNLTVIINDYNLSMNHDGFNTLYELNTKLENLINEYESAESVVAKLVNEYGYNDSTEAIYDKAKRKKAQAKKKHKKKALNKKREKLLDKSFNFNYSDRFKTIYHKYSDDNSLEQLVNIKKSFIPKFGGDNPRIHAFMVNACLESVVARRRNTTKYDPEYSLLKQLSKELRYSANDLSSELHILSYCRVSKHSNLYLSYLNSVKYTIIKQLEKRNLKCSKEHIKYVNKLFRYDYKKQKDMSDDEIVQRIKSKYYKNIDFNEDAIRIAISEYRIHIARLKDMSEAYRGLINDYIDFAVSKTTLKYQLNSFLVLIYNQFKKVAYYLYSWLPSKAKKKIKNLESPVFVFTGALKERPSLLFYILIVSPIYTLGKITKVNNLISYVYNKVPSLPFARNFQFSKSVSNIYSRFQSNMILNSFSNLFTNINNNITVLRRKYLLQKVVFNSLSNNSYKYEVKNFISRVTKIATLNDRQISELMIKISNFEKFIESDTYRYNGFFVKLIEYAQNSFANKVKENLRSRFDTEYVERVFEFCFLHLNTIDLTTEVFNTTSLTVAIQKKYYKRKKFPAKDYSDIISELNISYMTLRTTAKQYGEMIYPKSKSLELQRLNENDNFDPSACSKEIFSTINLQNSNILKAIDEFISLNPSYVQQVEHSFEDQKNDIVNNAYIAKSEFLINFCNRNINDISEEYFMSLVDIKIKENYLKNNSLITNSSASKFISTHRLSSEILKIKKTVDGLINAHKKVDSQIYNIDLSLDNLKELIENLTDAHLSGLTYSELFGVLQHDGYVLDTYSELYKEDDEKRNLLTIRRKFIEAAYEEFRKDDNDKSQEKLLKDFEEFLTTLDLDLSLVWYLFNQDIYSNMPSSLPGFSIDLKLKTIINAYNIFCSECTIQGFDLSVLKNMIHPELLDKYNLLLKLVNQDNVNNKLDENLFRVQVNNTNKIEDSIKVLKDYLQKINISKDDDKYSFSYKDLYNFFNKEISSNLEDMYLKGSISERISTIGLDSSTINNIEPSEFYIPEMFYQILSKKHPYRYFKHDVIKKIMNFLIENKFNYDSCLELIESFSNSKLQEDLNYIFSHLFLSDNATKDEVAKMLENNLQDEYQSLETKFTVEENELDKILNEYGACVIKSAAIYNNNDSITSMDTESFFSIDNYFKENMHKVVTKFFGVTKPAKVIKEKYSLASSRYHEKFFVILTQINENFRNYAHEKLTSPDNSDCKNYKSSLAQSLYELFKCVHRISFPYGAGAKNIIDYVNMILNMSSSNPNDPYLNLIGSILYKIFNVDAVNGKYFVSNEEALSQDFIKMIPSILDEHSKKNISDTRIYNNLISKTVDKRVKKYQLAFSVVDSASESASSTENDSDNRLNVVERRPNGAGHRNRVNQKVRFDIPDDNNKRMSINTALQF